MSSIKTLFVLRHAKSSWDDYEESDFDRPLTSRGLKDISKLALARENELREVGIIVSSPANRAVHTTITLCGAANIPLSVISLNGHLYETTEQVVKSIVSGLPVEKNCALIVGHNPTFTYFVNEFLPEPIENLPTGALVRLDFTAENWSGLHRDNLLRSWFDYPKNYL
ncbi:MAG: histidine phosphatase family protein [Tenuifilaceae bacterium]|jgi:phosphohistidine phosphatase|nr:histidine phosphatase family protein [Tenuifilaceae bacterium]